MTETSSAGAKPDERPKSVHVTVTFPIAPGGPYHADLSPETTVGSVRSSAMVEFGVAEEGQHAYYLTHSGTRVPDERTIGDVADHARAVKFTLVKELIQG